MAEDLEQLNYRQLQKLAKAHGVRANQKKDRLIQELRAALQTPTEEAEAAEAEAEMEVVEAVDNDAGGEIALPSPPSKSEMSAVPPTPPVDEPAHEQAEEEQEQEQEQEEEDKGDDDDADAAADDDEELAKEMNAEAGLEEQPSLMVETSQLAAEVAAEPRADEPLTIEIPPAVLSPLAPPTPSTGTRRKSLQRIPSVVAETNATVAALQQSMTDLHNSARKNRSARKQRSLAAGTVPNFDAMHEKSFSQQKSISEVVSRPTSAVAPKSTGKRERAEMEAATETMTVSTATAAAAAASSSSSASSAAGPSSAARRPQAKRPRSAVRGTQQEQPRVATAAAAAAKAVAARNAKQPKTFLTEEPAESSSSSSAAASLPFRPVSASRSNRKPKKTPVKFNRATELRMQHIRKNKGGPASNNCASSTSMMMPTFASQAADAVSDRQRKERRNSKIAAERRNKHASLAGLR